LRLDTIPPPEFRVPSSGTLSFAVAPRIRAAKPVSFMQAYLLPAGEQEKVHPVYAHVAHAHFFILFLSSS
jgi:hypothetical protein